MRRHRLLRRSPPPHPPNSPINLVLRELLPIGSDVNGRVANGWTLLWRAARDRELCKAWASLTVADNAGRTPLFAAAVMGHLEVVQWLAGNGGSVTQPANDGRTPLYIAALQGPSRSGAVAGRPRRIGHPAGQRQG